MKIFKKKYNIFTNSSKDRLSKKHLFQVVDDEIVFEASSFYRPEMNRFDLCLSSTAGCSFGCVICQCSYSEIGYQRNLTANEIQDQIEFILEEGKQFICKDTTVLVVFMGNGDPFYNVKSMLEAIEQTHNKYSSIVTRYGLSTIGFNIQAVHQVSDLSKQLNTEIRIQFSMVGMNQQQRKELLPNSLPLYDALPYLDWYSSVTMSKVRYNFPMIKGVNDSLEHLDNIADFIFENQNTRVPKLSTYNEISGNDFISCSDEVITSSARYLQDKGLSCVEIFIANRDIGLHASCGQLRDFDVFSHSENLTC